MNLSWKSNIENWMRKRTSRRRRAGRTANVESLEQRTLLTVSSLFADNELTIVSDDGDDSIAIGTSAANPLLIELTINGVVDTALPPIAASDIGAITVIGSDGANQIDLRGVTPTDFDFVDSVTMNPLQIVVDGGNGNDTLFSSSGFDDTLRAGQGNDVVDARSSVTTALLVIEAGDGMDTVFGGVGNDDIDGGDGADSIFGGDGNDTIFAGDGSDTVEGNDGADSIDGDEGADSILGGPGDDFINGSFGNDTVHGETGNDFLIGGAFNDSILGGEGDDVILGNGGQDFINGDTGNDMIRSGSSADTAIGGEGNDTINAGTGSDVVTGNAGDDSLLGGGSNDSIDGGSGDDFLFGNAGNDTIKGGGGSDVINGGSGNDLLQSVDAAIAINDFAVDEGASGETTTIVFTIGLSAEQLLPVSVQFATEDDTALAGSDYLPAIGTAEFLPGQTTTTVSVTVQGDDDVEAGESFFLNLFNASTGVLIVDGQGLGTINNDDVQSGLGTPIVNTAGIGNQPLSPPDTVGDVGLDFFVQSINGPAGSLVQIYNKDGSIAVPAFPMTQLAPAGTPGQNGAGDPIILFDHLADRWFMAEFTNGTNDLNIYISQTSTPTSNPADWYYYNFTAPNFPDYPKFAVWPDGYYATSNESGDPPVYVFDRTNMLLGQAAQPFQRVTTPALAGFGFQALTPADLDGPAPVAGAPALFMRHRDDEAHNVGANDPTQDFLEIYEYSTDFATPANSTFGLSQTISISEFDSELNGFFSFSAITQPGGAPPLDPLREVIMWRLSYRDMGTHEVLLGNLVTDVTGTDVAGIRWFELRRDPGATQWTLYQEGTHTLPDGDSRWMAAIAMDDAGNIALAYSVSGPSTFPSLRYTGRRASDPLGQMTQGEINIIDGTSSQQGSVRWGDYASLSVDPVDGSTFWFTSEYGVGGAWSTQVASFEFSMMGTTGGTVGGTPLSIADVAPDTINGGSGEDTIFGSSGADLLVGDQGSDLVHAGAGNDTVYGGAGNDTLNGSSGDDSLIGNGGRDIFNGGAGDDIIVWRGDRDGDDTWAFEDGSDTLQVNGGSAVDVFNIGQDAGTLVVSQTSGSIRLDGDSTGFAAGPEVVEINGNGGNDRININQIDDVGFFALSINGGSGNDIIDGRDVLIGNVPLFIDGGAGDDAITGTAGTDNINGGDGNDNIVSRAGDDVIRAGAGDDFVDADGGDDQVFGEDGNDTIFGGNGNDSIEGGFGNDSILAGDGNDSVTAGFGDDYILGDLGNDLLEGDAGRDVLIGAAGDDTLDGGRNDDTLIANSGDDKIRGDHGDDFIKGGSGNDTIDGGDGDDVVNAESGDDAITGGDGDDFINGSNGEDTIVGGDGDDNMLGGGSQDLLVGQDGDDTLIGNGGTDILVGGLGDNSILVPPNLASEIDESFVLTTQLLAVLDASN